MHPIIKFRRIGNHDLPLPAYATPRSSGMDLMAVDGFEIVAGQRMLIPTGFGIEIPEGFEGQIRPRSGLALRDGVTVLNTPGTIDCDYRGEICVLLYRTPPDVVEHLNGVDSPLPFRKGARIAQLVIAPVARAEIMEAGELSQTIRGEGGFGSTGR